MAAELSAEHPGRVNKLVLSNCPSWAIEEGEKWANNPPEVQIEITPNSEFMKHIWEFGVSRMPNRLDKAYELALDYMKAGTRVGEGHQAAFRYNILPKLIKIKQPTLVIGGDNSILFPYYQATLDHIPHAHGHIIKGGTGMVLHLMPQAWGKAALEFLKT